MKLLLRVTVPVLWILVGLLVSPRSYGQQSVYGELLGNSIAVSLNYDYIASGGYGGRVGVGLSTFDRENGMSIPIAFQYVLGSTHRAELGLGVAYSSLAGGVYPLSSIAYRFQPDGQGILFRVALNPFQLLDSYPFVDRRKIRVGIGMPVCVSIGYSF
jgi:hypothetical protein